MSEQDPFLDDEEQDTEKALSSYSDLFAAISFCFLLLYVVASLQGTISHMETTKKVTAEQQAKIDELVRRYEQMLSAHQLKKDQYLQNAQEQEKKMYEDALANLHQLKSAEEERKEKLAAELSQAETKARALSDYQQMIKNIVESNLALKQKVAEKEAQLAQEKVAYEQETQDKFKGELKYQIHKLKKETAKEIEQRVAEEKKSFEAQLAAVESEKAENLKQVEAAKAQERKELEAKYAAQVDALQSEKAKTLKEKAALKHQLNVIAAEKAEAVRKLESDLELKVAAIEGDYKTREAKMQVDAQNREAQLKAEAAAAKSNAREAQHALAQVRSKQEITKAIVSSLADEFKKNGIDATIDPKTGEVTLNFLNVYFDLGQSSLKAEMEADINKFMPTYAKAIFADKRNSDAIDHIEVIGFASPTYDKKYVDPSQLKVQNLDAVSFNLDLSYKRAKSIFKHMFNPKKLVYDHQNEIFQITKVSGRSFLEGTTAQDGRSPASALSREEYCAKFDCKKQQKVVIKFHLKP